jgi:hypothetical protein
MAQHNKKTQTLIEMVKNHTGGEMNPAGVAELFSGEMVADVFATVPRHTRNGVRNIPIHAVVKTQNGFDPVFVAAIAEAYRNQLGRQSSKPQAKPGETPAQATKLLASAARKGLLTTAGQLPPRGDRGRKLVDGVRVAADQRAGGGRRGRG